MSTTKSGMPPLYMGERLSKVRRLKGYSQQYMAERLGISERQYSRYETGDSSLPPEKLTAACEALEVKEEDLLNFDEKFFFSNCTGTMVGGNSHNTYNEASEKERELYEARIKHLEEEVSFLRKQLEASLGAGRK